MARGMGASVAIEVESGSPSFLGVIDATTTSKTNSQATAPFNTAAPQLGLRTLLIQVSAECYILPVATATSTVTTSTGVKLAVDERVIINCTSTETYLAVITASGTANCRVWELK